MDGQNIDVVADLNALSSEEFEAKIAFASTAPVLRKLILGTPEFKRIREDLRLRLLSESKLRSFVEGLVEKLEKGRRFPYEAALAAIAVVLEARGTDFAEEYLLDLARLRLQETRNASAVAHESLRRWKRRTSETIRTFEVAPDDDEPGEEEFRLVTLLTSVPRNRQGLEFAYA